MNSSLDFESLLLRAQDYKNLDRKSLQDLEAEFWEFLCKNKNFLNQNLCLRQILIIQQCLKCKLYEIEPIKKENYNVSPEDVVSRFVSKIKSVGIPTNQHPVIILMPSSVFLVFMSQEDITCFSAFMQKIRDNYKECDQVKDALWQHWESVRTAFFDDTQELNNLHENKSLLS